MKKVQYVGESKRIFSPRIWADCPIEAIQGGRVDGFFFSDDFRNFLNDAGAAGSEIDDYLGFGDTGVTIKQSVDHNTGVLEIAGNDATEDEGNIAFGDATTVIGVISDTVADAKKLWFEGRIKMTTVGNTKVSTFFGLTSENLSGTGALLTDSSGVLKNVDFIGFHNLTATGKEIDFTYQKGSAGIIVPGENIGTFVSDTWINLGFVYDPDAPTAKRIKIVIDNIESTSYVTGTQIATATFPDAEQLTMSWATLNTATTTENKCYMDWWAFCQLG